MDIINISNDMNSSSINDVNYFDQSLFSDENDMSFIRYDDDNNRVLDDEFEVVERKSLAKMFLTSQPSSTHRVSISTLERALQGCIVVEHCRRNDIINKLKDTPATLVHPNQELRKKVQQIIHRKLKSKAAKIAINDAAASFCGQITSGAVLFDSWMLSSAMYATTNYKDLFEVEMTKQLTFRNGFSQKNSDDMPMLAATMRLQALFGYVTSDGTVKSSPPGSVDCVSFHQRLVKKSDKSNGSGDYDKSNGSVAIDTKMEVAKPLLTHALENCRVIHLNGKVSRSAFQATILDDAKRWEIVALSDEDIVQRILPDYEPMRYKYSQHESYNALIVNDTKSNNVSLVITTEQLVSIHYLFYFVVFHFI